MCKDLIKLSILPDVLQDLVLKYAFNLPKDQVLGADNPGYCRHEAAVFLLSGENMELALQYISAEPDSLFYTDRIFRRYVSRYLRQ